MFEAGMLLKILVTVIAFGQPPFSELLPKEYPTMRADECVAVAEDIVARAHEGVAATAVCVPIQTREI